MTSVATPRKPQERHSTLRPYARNPDSPEGRGIRRWAVGLLAVFSLLWGVVFAFAAPSLLLGLLTPVVILALAVIWALPDLRTAPARVLERNFFLFVIVLIVWPNYVSIILPGLPWISLRRLISTPLAIVFLICLAVSKDFRGHLALVLRAERPIWVMLLIFVAIQTSSIVFSATPLTSLDKWIDDQIAWTCMFFIACYLFTKPGWPGRWAATLWGCAIVVGLIAIWEWRMHHVPWANHLPNFIQMDPTVAAELAPRFRAYTALYRVQSTFGTSLGLGEYMALATPFVLHFALGHYSRTVRIVAALSLPFLCFVAWITHARSGLIGVLIAVALYGLYWGVREWRRRTASMLGPAVILSYPILSSLAFASTFVLGRLHSAVWGGGEAASSTLGRMTQYGSGIPKVLTHPWGYGIGRAGETLGFREPSGLLTIDTYYLAIALEYGVIGFIVYYLMFLYAAIMAGKYALHSADSDPETSFLAPAAISLVSFLVIKAVFSQQDNHPLYFMLLGMVMALIYRARTAELTRIRAAEAAPNKGQFATPDGRPRSFRRPAHQPASP